MRHWQGRPRALVDSLPLELRKHSLAVALSALGWECGGNRARVGPGDPRGSFPSQPIPGCRGRAGRSSGRVGALERGGQSAAAGPGRSGWGGRWCR